MFQVTSTMRFQAPEDLEVFVKQMPWDPADHEAILNDRIVTEDDEVDFQGGKIPVHHTFRIIKADR